MSHEATSWAFQQTSLQVFPRMLLIYLANWADPHGYAYPGIKTLAEQSGMSESSAKKHLDTLYKKGLVFRIRRYAQKTGEQTSHIFALNLTGAPDPPRLEEIPYIYRQFVTLHEDDITSSTCVQGVGQDSTQVGQDSTQVGQDSTPNLTPSNTPSNTPSVEGNDEAGTLWSTALHNIQEAGRVTRPAFKTFLQPTKAIGFQDGRLVVSVPNSYIADGLESRMLALVENTIEDLSGGVYRDILLEVSGDSNPA